MEVDIEYFYENRIYSFKQTDMGARKVQLEKITEDFIFENSRLLG